VVLGGIYGLIFRRAANDRRGGWLFGIGFGFLSWMCSVGLVGAVRAPLAVGHDAIALMLAFLAYGTLLGSLFPVVHRLFMARFDQAPRRRRQPQAP
jgi:cytochrome c biogenesis protein CcdA